MVGRKRFEFQEHVADEIVIAYGASLEEAFENAALALFEVMTDTDTVEPNHEDIFEVEGFDELALLYSWIENFIVEFDVNLKVYSKFKIDQIIQSGEVFRLRGRAWGEVFTPGKHPSEQR